jgi:hypothetical protein
MEGDQSFVPAAFVVPVPPRTDHFWLEPLGPQHNQADYDAWTSSMAHILATPGFESGSWPHPMTLEENLGDLQMHARHFAERVGFTYTVRGLTDGDVVGCVYIYPSDDAGVDARVRSWVRESRADWDQELADCVGTWLVQEWPFTSLRYR